jgi:hypothetical protein
VISSIERFPRRRIRAAKALKRRSPRVLHSRNGAIPCLTIDSLSLGRADASHLVDGEGDRGRFGQIAADFVAGSEWWTICTDAAAARLNSNRWLWI